MNPDLAKEITILRLAVKAATKIEPQYATQFEKRKEIEQQLLALDNLPPQERAKIEHKRIELRKQLRKIDHAIDLEKEKNPKNSLKKLVTLLTTHAPDSASEYATLRSRKENAILHKKKIEEVKEPLTLLLKELKIALKAHHGRFNLRGWLFGRTPRSMATHHINNACLMAKFFLDEISENTLPLLIQIRENAEQLWNLRDTRWSRKNFAALFDPFLEKFTTLNRALQDQELALESELATTDEAILQWIDTTAKRLL